jgi:desulfoferrodoxin-like iron-binding protein
LSTFSGFCQILKTSKTYNPDSFPHGFTGPVRAKEGDIVVNVQNAGETYRCNVCGNVVIVREAGGGELVCHGEPMQRVEGQENVAG